MSITEETNPAIADATSELAVRETSDGEISFSFPDDEVAPVEVERVPAFKYLLEIGTTTGFYDVESARQVASIVNFALGEDKGGVRIREVKTFRSIPLVAPARLVVTRNQQGAEGTAGNLAKNVRTALNITDVNAYKPVIILDEPTRTWGVDFKVMTENVKELANEEFSREECVAAFQKAVSETLAAEALRGISMK
jgi:hypothetical protein